MTLSVVLVHPQQLEATLALVKSHDGVVHVAATALRGKGSGGGETKTTASRQSAATHRLTQNTHADGHAHAHIK